MSEQPTGPAAAPAPWTPTLSFDAWADLSARLMGLEQDRRFEVLDEQKVPPKEWTRCDQHYVRALGTDVAQGRRERVEIYGRKCAEEMDRRSKAGAAPAPPEQPAPKADPPPDAPVAAFVAPPAPASEPVAVPSFLKPDAAPMPLPPVVRAPANLVATAMAFELPTAIRAGALPFSKHAAPSLAPFSQQPKPPPPPAEGPGGTQRLGATMALDNDLHAIVQAALPFAGAPAPKPPPPAFPRMPLQSYATLHAELAAFPQRAAEIRQKYAIADEAAQAALDQSWQARFDAHPETRAEWQRLAVQHRQWLAGQAR
jgi:hypothetical protein